MNEDYRTQLKRYNDFVECQMFDYWSEDLCRTFVVLVGLIWDEEGKLNEPTNFFTPVYMRFEVCQRIDINNSFSKWRIDNPEDVDPGANEFSVIKVMEAPDGWHRFRFLWEDERHLEVLCQKLVINKAQVTPEMMSKYPFIK